MGLSDLVTNPDALKSSIEATRSLIAAVKDLVSFWPNDGKREAALKAVASAERAALIAEAQIAQALGYRLCKCQFPPRPMLSTGRFDDHGVQIYQCPDCKIDTTSKAKPIRPADWVV